VCAYVLSGARNFYLGSMTGPQNVPNDDSFDLVHILYFRHVILLNDFNMHFWRRPACSEVECKTTDYPLHSHVSPSLPLPCVTVCHQVSTELYNIT